MALFVICGSAMVILISEYIFFPKRIVMLSYAICFFQGFVSIPISSVGMDLGVELTYPIGESFSTGILMSAGQIFGIIYTLICSTELTKRTGVSSDSVGAKVVFLILAGACLFGFLLIPFIK